MANFNLGYGLQHDLNVSQELNLAPQLLQWLRILQVSTTDLSTLVQAELETNPALEIDDSQRETEVAAPPESDGPAADREFEPGPDALGEKLEYLAGIDESWRDEETAGGMASGRSDAGDDAQDMNDYLFNSVTRPASLQEHLAIQIRLLDRCGFNERLGELIVGSLDERGYLNATLDELAALSGEPAAVVERTLATVQNLAPAGVAARDLRECLLLQLQGPDANPLARVLVDKHLQTVARKQFADLAALLDVTEADVLDAVRAIRALDPEPGRRFVEYRVEPVEPDVMIVRRGDDYAIELTDQRIPRLRLSASCQRLIKQENLNRDEIAYVRRKMRAATFLIQGISQRQETLKNTVAQVVRFQRDFLDSASPAPDALTMATVARLIGVHETTVSRAIANKYVRTPRGLFPLRHFFRTGIRCADGSRMTPQQVMEFMAETIRREDPRAPLLDRDLVRELGKRGLRIARRTVAKYREELGISASKDRKRADVRPAVTPHNHNPDEGESSAVTRHAA